MRVTEAIPEHLGSIADMAACATGTVKTKIPYCQAPCECVDCETYYYPMEQQKFDIYHYTQVLTDAEATGVLAGHTKVINSARAYLQESIHKYGDLLLERWRKRVPKKRAALLREAEPDLPLNKGYSADTQHADHPVTFEDQRSSHYRTHLLLPYLDVDTLSRNSATLLSLIHTRAKEAPSDWAPHDHEQLRQAWGVGLVDVRFNKGAVIMYGTHYGAYTAWQQDRAHRFDIVGFPRGELILEAQAHLLLFLERLVKLLLGNNQQLDATNAVGCARWYVFIGDGLKMIGDPAAWSTFVQTPFVGPPRFEIDTLVDLVKARVTATGDHLWLLQTESSYFRRYMRKLYQMRVVETVHDKRLAVTVINWEIVEDIYTHWIWHAILLEFEKLQKLYHRYRDSICAGYALPTKINRSMGALELLLVNVTLERSKQFQASISQRPGFRMNYVYGTTTLGAKGLYRGSHQIKQFAATQREGNIAVYREQRLWWILTQIGCKPDSQTRFHYDMLLRLLDDHLSKADLQERARLDEILFEKLSDYATMLELLWSIRLHCPRNATRHITDCKATEDGIYWRTSKTVEEIQRPDLTAAIKALENFRKFNPPAGARDLKWLQQYDLIHRSYQQFWSKMEFALKDNYQKVGLSESDVRYCMEPLQWWNDADHVSRLENKRQKIDAEIQRLKTSKSDGQYVPLPYVSPSSSNLDTSDQPREKEKTRGRANTHEVGLAEAAEPTEASVETIELSRSPYTTLRSMFPDTVEEHGKSVSWSAFVNSMNEAGFAARNGGGSIVRFENRKGEGSINFHRPHPDPTIDPVMLQAMGQRMNRWFGWTRETFALVKK